MIQGKKKTSKFRIVSKINNKFPLICMLISKSYLPTPLFFDVLFVTENLRYCFCCGYLYDY